MSMKTQSSARGYAEVPAKDPFRVRAARKRKQIDLSLFRPLCNILVLSVLVAVGLFLVWNLPATRYHLQSSDLILSVCRWIDSPCELIKTSPYADLERIRLHSVELFATPEDQSWVLFALMTNDAVQPQPMPVVSIRFYDKQFSLVAEDALLPSEYAPNSVSFGSKQVQRIEVKLKNVPLNSASYQVSLRDSAGV